jgi:hypothetical protein
MRRRICSLGLGLVTALGASAIYSPVTASTPTATIHTDATTGTATKVQPTAGPRAASTSGDSRNTDRGARPQVRQGPATAAPNTAAPRTSAAAPANTAPLIKTWNGVSSHDSQVTNFGQEFQPPDQGLCVGNGFVMEQVNSAYSIYNTDGKLLAGPFNVNGPYDEGLIEYTSDPRCYFDKATNTWFAVIIFLAGNGGGDNSHIDIAVNPSGDPTTIWTNYKIDTTYLNTPHHTGCPCFGDQPTLGMDPDNLYVTANDFSILGPENNGAQIYAIAKSDLVNLAASPHFVHWDNLHQGGSLAQIIQPSLSQGNPQAEFFISSLDPNLTFDQRLAVWAMTNRSVVATGGKPTLSSMVIKSEAYGVPPRAVQKGSSNTLDSGDDRINEAQYVNGNVWASLTTGVTIPDDTAQHSGVAWFKVHPWVGGSPSVLQGVNMVQQGYVSSKGNDIMYPAIAVTRDGAAGMVFSMSGPTHYPSAAYASLAPGASSFSVPTIAAFGTGPYVPSSRSRWGDYSWAALDPSGNSFWFSTEYIPPQASQTQSGTRNWGTRVLHVGLPT